MNLRILATTTLALAAFHVSSHATAAPIHTLAFGFGAPSVNGVGNVTNMEPGQIVFDSSTSTFMGYTVVGPVLGWQPFSGAATTSTTPKVTKLTAASGTFTTSTSPAPLYIRVRMSGGGGGGGGAGTTGATGGTGGSSSFGTSLLFVTGGGGGAYATIGGVGGTATIGTGASGINLSGGSGTAAVAGAPTSYPFGGNGGTNSFGGSVSSSQNGTDEAGSGGGGGSGTSTSTFSGSGGGAGGYIDAIITSPAATYTYTVGIGGSGGTNGLSGTPGGIGGKGVIIVEEFFQ